MIKIFGNYFCYGLITNWSPFFYRKNSAHNFQKQSALKMESGLDTKICVMLHCSKFSVMASTCAERYHASSENYGAYYLRGQNQT